MQVIYDTPMPYVEFSRNVQLYGPLPVFECPKDVWDQPHEAPRGTLYIPEHYPAARRSKVLEHLKMIPALALAPDFEVRVIEVTDVPEDILDGLCPHCRGEA